MKGYQFWSVISALLFAYSIYLAITTDPNFPLDVLLVKTAIDNFLKM